ncbi:hypothetical protein PLICBS_005971 [Purpureocillium lilacinum]|uniref:uncharacterized protein n=1 Tax=Purpureocillium lilacinum TaxID=33203 RepID=UPI00208CD0AE|nr:hypothetical protein PLICBS_005971 [Purpureocillium lilacinum]
MEKAPTGGGGATPHDEGVFHKKQVDVAAEHVPSDEYDSSAARKVELDLNATEDDILEAKELASSMSLETVRKLMTNILAIHEGDPNFPFVTLERIRAFMDIVDNPEKHEDLVQEMKIEAALITNNSPYAEVRAIVDNHDDPNMPVSTIRAWTLGCFFGILLASVNELFAIRQPSITLGTNMAQLLAYPAGKAWERWMPKWEIPIPFTGQTANLNPGPFNKKEHMVIAIMSATAKSNPYTGLIVWLQVLPQYFDQQYARNWGYMVAIAFSVNFLGYGMAGLTRKWLVYPAYCLWPTSLVVIALNSALHQEDTQSVMGPFRRIWTMTRYKFFMYVFIGMFIYFWLPNYIFQALSYFSWMTWISPRNRELTILTGVNLGMGLFNPFPTFDWNIISYSVDPLMLPAFATFNSGFGIVWDHFGKRYNATRVLDERGHFDLAKYEKYSAAYMGATQVLVYGLFFACYSSVVTHVALYQRHELKLGFKNFWSAFNPFKWTSKTNEGATQRTEDGAYTDVHNRLMSSHTGGIMMYQINIKNVCTDDAPSRFYCPDNNTFMLASVFWGVIGPLKVFGINGQYKWLLLGFPLGIVFTSAMYGLQKAFPRTRWLRQIHPVILLSGGLNWAPYSFSYMWPAVPVAWASWIYIRSRYLAFWSRYNYVLSAALNAGVAVSALVMLFSVQWVDINIDWWGNSVIEMGCEAKSCLWKPLAPGERFYPWWDSTKVPAP